MTEVFTNAIGGRLRNEHYPLSESSPFRPNLIYSDSKLLAEATNTNYLTHSHFPILFDVVVLSQLADLIICSSSFLIVINQFEDLSNVKRYIGGPTGSQHLSPFVSLLILFNNQRPGASVPSQAKCVIRATGSRRDKRGSGCTAVVILLEYIPNRYLLTQATCCTNQFSREQTAGRSSDHGFDEVQPFFVGLRGELFERQSQLLLKLLHSPSLSYFTTHAYDSAHCPPGARPNKNFRCI